MAEFSVNKSLKSVEWNYPILISNSYFSKEFYDSLKFNFPDFSKHEWNECGQQHRKNIVIKEYNDISKNNLHESFESLYEHFDSVEFRNMIFNEFSEYFESNSFIGDIETADLELSVCEAVDGYENPFHVDTRKRIVHMLMYFGKDEIKEGGQLCVAKHKELDDMMDYPQYPKLDNIIETKEFEPEDNTLIVILSTPNSYHKGCSTIGKRNFLYIAFNNHNNKPAWRHKKNWNMKKTFKDAIKDQK